MKTEVLNIIQTPIKVTAFETTLSFKSFVDYLKSMSENADSSKHAFFNTIINEFEKYPETLTEIDVNEIHKYSHLLQLVYNTLMPLTDNEDNHFWGLSLPIRPVIFYSTNVFYDTIQKMIDGNLHNGMLNQSLEDLKQRKLLVTYSYILEQCYNIKGFYTDDLIYPMKDLQSGLSKYYKQKLDNRFIKINALQELPELDLDFILTNIHNKEKIITYLEEKIPLDMFQANGFSIISITDETTNYITDHIKDMLLQHNGIEATEDYSEYIQSLKTLVGTNEVEFGLLPILQVNNKLVFSKNSCNNSALAKLSKSENNIEDLYKTMLEDYIKNPELIYFSNITEEKEENPCMKELAQSGVVSCAVVPIFFNKTLVGVLDLFTTKKDVMAETLLAAIEPAIPLLSQLMKNSIDNFNAEIVKVITEKFTSLQPSVQWKFNEVALHYLQAQQNGEAETEEIIFDNVYPLYGAVDIRNSTIERNHALQLDLKVQFEVLIDVLQKLKNASGFGLIDEKIFTCHKWLTKVTDLESFNEEIKLNDFLNNDIFIFLTEFTKGNSQYETIVKPYLEAIDEKTGVANAHRIQLEKSMTTVISAVNNYFDTLKTEIQKAYPSYFEKFRTDGVEYDIYIGQSLTPDKPYNPIYLKNLRLLQLTSMATITKHTHALLPKISTKVETTQLIFIHSQPIDIKFRKDEKRFDVEGAYNIRYHIIKKRIDKVRIKETNERLTQPNKIALVYFSTQEAEEYVLYIRYLQGEKILLDDLEYLELEELQGVLGLRALRVGVNVD